MLEVILGLAACLAAVFLAGEAVTRRRRRMRRHPAPTFVFADLVGYSALTERRGNAVGADVAREFRRAMCTLSREYGSWQVKSMGDEVMIWCPEPDAAIGLAIRAVRDVGARTDLLPVRVGVHTGPAVMRGCDWYGSAVNIAARLAREAQPGEALISGATRSAASQELAPLERQRTLVLRGLHQPVSAWRLA